MPVESASYISELNTTYPDGANPKSEGDNHLRLVKTVLQTQFPNLGAAAVTPTAVELNYVDGVTSSIQAQINTLSTGKADVSGETYSGTHDFTGAVINVATPTANSHPVTKLYADGLAFSSALPAISASTKDKIISNDGTVASWVDTPLVTAESFFLASI